jgi:hypothetical protein
MPNRVVMSDSGATGYLFPAWLINLLIASILSGLVTIGGYMYRWNVEDASWKAAVAERLSGIEYRLRITEQIPINSQRITDLERRMIDVEGEQRRHRVGERP